MKLNIFVYGTLRMNQMYHPIIKDEITSVTTANYRGWLYDLPYGYPAMVHGNGKITGELVTFSKAESVLAKLDELEGYIGPGQDNEYERIHGYVELEDQTMEPCQLYVYPAQKRDWLQSDAILVSSGDWVKWKEGEDEIYYFAYGSCMNQRDFSRTVEQFEVLGKACLADYRVGFTRYSSVRNGGVADIVPEPSHVTEGVLYRFPKRFLKHLDEREGVGTGAYRRKTIEVHYAGERLPVLTYEVVNKLDQDMVPGDGYQRLILEGAGSLGEDYQMWLRHFMEKLKK